MTWRLDGAALAGRLGACDLAIDPGVTALVGASGAGKTSLVELLVGHATPTAGRVDFTPPPGRRPRFWQPQDGGLWPGVSAADHVALVGGDRAILDALGLADVADAVPARLSRGQQDRLALARALASGAGALVLDEPLAHVDAAGARDGWRAIRDAGAPTLVFATHDPARVLAEAPTVIALAGGRVRYAGPTDALYRRPETAALGWLLGPLTWFDDPGPWLDAPPPHACVRPECLSVVPGGPLTVVETRFAGAWCETTLARGDARRTVLHRPPAPPAEGPASLRVTHAIDRASG